MKNLFLFTIILSVFATANFGQNKSNIDGNWCGTLDAGGATLTFILKISKIGDDYAAHIDTPEQGIKDLPLDSIILNDKTVKFLVIKFNASYEGIFDEKSDKINGKFKQGTAILPLNFNRATSEEISVNRPQTPNKPYAYNEEEVSYKNEKDNVKLAGTLTFPKGEGKFPAVILITGSGSQDRDETIFGHKPFLVLADYLTRKGIAVLRVDDRGIGDSDSGSPLATTENYVGDVLRGIEYLKTRKEINTKQIGLIGHSEGGIIAPSAAVRSKDVEFIVMLAGTGQTGEEVIISQMTATLRVSGATPEEITQKVDLQKSLFAIVKSEPDEKLGAQKINEMLEKLKSKMNGQKLEEFAPIEKSIKNGKSTFYSPWYRYFLFYNPRPTLEKVRIPVLALNGENDTQVSAKENLEIISAALKTSGNKDFMVKSFPKLNHLFQKSKTGLVGEYGTIEETISPQILETISDWILKHTSSK